MNKQQTKLSISSNVHNEAPQLFIMNEEQNITAPVI